MVGTTVCKLAYWRMVFQSYTGNGSDGKEMTAVLKHETAHGTLLVMRETSLDEAIGRQDSLARHKRKVELALERGFSLPNGPIEAAPKGSGKVFHVEGLYLQTTASLP